MVVVGVDGGVGTDGWMEGGEAGWTGEAGRKLDGVRAGGMGGAGWRWEGRGAG